MAFGLQVIRAPDLLRQHLGLGHGIGLVITDVVASSAAHRRGFLANDVLVSIDDQSLFVPEQLAVLLEGVGPAASRSCTLIRHGARMTIALDAPAATEPAVAPPETDAKPQAKVATNTETRAEAKRGPLKPTPSTLALLPNRKKARSLAIEAGVKPAAGVVRRTGDAGIVQEDFDYSIEVSREDETRLVARDARGRRVFDDAIETPEQRSRIPLAIRDRVEQLERLLDRQLQAATRQQPVAEIGSLDITPIEVR
jgi:pyruvate/2-oxoglutarate dehydrogenase complex dihydrolipoamide acyltransferase (E2) component